LKYVLFLLFMRLWN